MRNKNGLGTVFRKTVYQNKRITFLTGILIIACVATALFPPLVLEQIVNQLTLQQPISLLLPFSYFGLLALSNLLESSQSVMITIFGQKMTHSLRSELCAKLNRLPAGYFTQHTPAKIASRFVNDVDVVDSLFTNGIIGMIVDAFKILSILLIIFYKSTGLGILMLLVTPALFAMTRLFQKKTLKAQLENRIAISKVNNHVPETIHNIRTIHTLFRQKYMEEKYDAYIQESYRALDKSNLYDSIYSPIIVFVSSCLIAVMMIFAALGGEMQQFFGITVGTSVAIIAYVGKVFDPLENIGMEIQNIQSAVAGVKRINEFLAEEERTVPENILDWELFDANREAVISFHNVEFGYDDETVVLQNLSFSIRQGETVIFTGRTGAGKSTIFKLILGLYAPQKGLVSIYGTEAGQIPDVQKRKLFGYVEQNFGLIAGTVAEQISLFDDSISQKQIEEAATLVGLHENIMELDQGYNTPVENLAFSQGQFQLLSIARAIVTQPKILLLDEITANLDNETEFRVLQGLNRACKGRTVLSISHRLGESMHGSRLIQISK